MAWAQQVLGPVSSRWDFHAWHQCEAKSETWTPAGRHTALVWLRQFKGDPASMSGLRSMVHALHPATLPPGFSNDEQVLEALSGLLSSGVLHVHSVPPPVTGYRDPAYVAAPAQAAPATRRPAPSQSSSSTAPVRAAEEADTFSSATDAAATAAVLRSAAESGVPFCEECAKAAAAAAARRAA